MASQGANVRHTQSRLHGSVSDNLSKRIMTDVSALVSSIATLEHALNNERAQKEEALRVLASTKVALAKSEKEKRDFVHENDIAKSRLSQSLNENAWLKEELSSASRDLQTRTHQLKAITSGIADMQSQMLVQFVTLLAFAAADGGHGRLGISANGGSSLFQPLNSGGNPSQDLRDSTPVAPPGFGLSATDTTDVLPAAGQKDFQQVPQVPPGFERSVQQPKNSAKAAATSGCAQGINPNALGASAETSKRTAGAHHDSHSQPTLRKIGVWLIGERLGGGSYGTVFEARHERTGETAAVKFEKVPPGTISYNRHERFVYESVIRAAQGRREELRVPRVLELVPFDDGTGNGLVMQRLGPSISDIAMDQGCGFELQQVLCFGIQAISCLEQVHKAGFIHGDVKPNNFMVDFETGTKLYVADLGGSIARRSYPVGEPFERKKVSQFLFTSIFASDISLRMLQQVFADDLEALWYVIVCMLRDGLPWDNIRDGEHAFKDILEARQKIGASTLCGEVRVLCQYFDYARNLRPEENPDYEMLRSLLRSGLDLMSNSVTSLD